MTTSNSQLFLLLFQVDFKQSSAGKEVFLIAGFPLFPCPLEFQEDESYALSDTEINPEERKEQERISSKGRESRRFPSHPTPLKSIK